MRVPYSASAMQARTTFTSVKLRSVQSTQDPREADALQNEWLGSGLRPPGKRKSYPFQCGPDRASIHVRRRLFHKNDDHPDGGDEIACLSDELAPSCVSLLVYAYSTVPACLSKPDLFSYCTKHNRPIFLHAIEAESCQDFCITGSSKFVPRCAP